ncbi:AI-2E family transporter [Lacinutrix sp.]|uniref:AI-2E family transporter n=1 Tax=Lacinutrix sp. TaxID=1937692 RepID=UPI002631BE2C|nr:AI-2E family transporter [Lacinutrix sp.]MDG1715444.1 AI-2E family transporter [Lacinutrix sp.]
MNSNTISNGILKSLGIILGIFLLLFFLYKIQSIIVYISIAAVISLIGRPIVLFLRRRLKFRNTIAVIVTMVILIGLLIGLILLFIPLILEQGQNLSLLNINELQSNVEGLYKEIVAYFDLKHIYVEQSIKDSNLLGMIDYSVIPNFLNSLISGFGSFSIGLFSVLFISFFFLKDSKLFENGIMTFIPDNNELRLKKSSEKIKNLLSRYFVGLIFQILILFIIYTIFLLISGTENAIIIAFLCALLNLIPYVGPVISGVLIIVLSMTSNLGENFNEVMLPATIWAVVGFVIGQLIDNFISQPKIFSTATKAHPLEIFLVILIAGVLFGIVGLIVAVPAYTAIKVILKEFLSENKVVKKLTKHI